MSPHLYRFVLPWSFLAATTALLSHPVTRRTDAAEPVPRGPNVIVIFADDLGYGDLGCFGHPTIATPELDRMAAEGMRWTQFYSAACVCTPSRAGLLTGRLPARSGMCSDKRRVLFPDSAGGLPADEITLAEALKPLGYKTACVGKWHLGHLPEYLPTAHGFDHYFGIPYSNDMDRVASAPRGRAAFLEPSNDYWNVPILRDTQVIERPADQTTLTRRYTEEAIKFIRDNRQERFFLYLAHSMPHVPLFRSEDFANRSLRGLYGDVIEELDWSVGQVLQTLRELKIAQDTLVVFTSDNGPWLTQFEQGGSAGLLRDGKGSTWEGGMREPTLMWWPGKIPAGTTNREIGSTMDLFATVLSLNGQSLPADRTYDSFDLSGSMLAKAPGPRKSYFFYRGYRLMAVRMGPWKAHLITQPAYGRGGPTPHDPPVLYHLEHDPSERYNVAEKHPEVIERIRNEIEAHRAKMSPAETQLEARISAN